MQIDQPEICGYPQLNDDESYSIEILRQDANAAGSIRSKTVWGTLRALETVNHQKKKEKNYIFYI